VKNSKLEQLVLSHSGQFHCVKIHEEDKTKIVQFRHEHTAPVSRPELPNVGRLRDFYETFGSLTLFSDPETQEAARVIAAPSDWNSLRADLSGWFEDISDDERDEYLPEWIDSSLVIGETPRSGNYILMPTTGSEAGRVFEFDHDGFEFSEVGENIIDYVEKSITPDARRLSDFASHMRFIVDGDRSQWWIREMTDNRGARVSTDE
jgi:hypothetical protein